MDVIDIRIKVPVRDNASDAEVATPANYARYDEVYKGGGASNATLDDLLDEMGEHGIGRSVLQAENESGSPSIGTTASPSF